MTKHRWTWNRLPLAAALTVLAAACSSGTSSGGAPGGRAGGRRARGGVRRRGRGRPAPDTASTAVVGVVMVVLTLGPPAGRRRVNAFGATAGGGERQVGGVR